MHRSKLVTGWFSILLAAATLASCTSTRPVVPSITEMGDSFTQPAAATAGADYRLGASDIINITTFREPDLSITDVMIEDGGVIDFPLVGSVQAAGLTTMQLADRIEGSLRGRFLANPDVRVSVAEIRSRQVVVEGAVTRPGVFPIDGKATLLSAIALASGPTTIASIDDVVIFRTIDGKPMGAVFNLAEIRRGIMDDPKVIAGDKVVVNYSNGQKLYENFLTTSPLFAAVFRAVTN